MTNGDATFSLDVEAGGYGAVLVTSSGVDQDFQVYTRDIGYRDYQGTRTNKSQNQTRLQ